jgi:tRNA A37 threonylcarbamoyladenosine dehydratase
MKESFSRSALLLGESGMERLARSKICIFGVGGVGGYCAEALARSGVGEIHLVDSDVVSVSNINRQIIATEKTVGTPKVDAMRSRILEINSECKVFTHNIFYTPKHADEINLEDFDYIVDAIDTVKSKLHLIETAYFKNVRIISSMGAGNKLSATSFEVADINKTSVCPLAKVIRRELRMRGVKRLKVVYSKEEPISAVAEESHGRHSPGSIAFIPSVVGLIIAGEVIKDIALQNH